MRRGATCLNWQGARPGSRSYFETKPGVDAAFIGDRIENVQPV